MNISLVSRKSCFRLLMATLLFAIGSLSCMGADEAASGSAAIPTPSPKLEEGFARPPSSAKPWAYWVWLGGNISKEGITADLEAMKRVGMGGGLIMSLGALARDPVTTDPVLFMTPQWRDMVHHAVSEAASLGLQIDLNNDDGWNCGGPWIKSGQGMQTLTWSETNVKGPQKFSGVLALPPTKLNTYREVAVLAVPAQGLDPLPAGSTTTSPERGKWVQLTHSQPVTARAVTVSQPAPSKKTPGRLLRCELQVSDDGNTFRSVRAFETGWRGIFRSVFPVQNVTVSFEPVTGRIFRLVVLEAMGKPEAGFALQGGERVSYWQQKAGFDHIAEHGAASPLFTLPGKFPDAQAGSCVPETGVLNLTSQVKPNGELNWDVPAGDWTVLRIGYTPTNDHNGFATPAGLGLDCDKLNAAALDTHFGGMIDKVIADAGPLAGKSLTTLHDDSLETDSQNWAAGFAEEFKKRRGYDPIPWLPVMAGGRVVGSPEQSERFLWDLRRTVADVMHDNYFEHFKELSHARGMQFTSEAAGRQQFMYDPIYYLSACDIPMGEFWSSEPRPRPDCKEAASAAHVYNLPFVAGESFTQAGGGRWMDTPFTLKTLGDAAFCTGVNKMIFHRMALQRWPDRKPGLAWPNIGVNFDTTQTWWDQSRTWMEYLSRCQFLLQQGRFVADAAVLTGEGVPNSIFRLTQEPVDPKRWADASTFDEAMLRRHNQMPFLPPVGYDYDGVTPEAVLQMQVRDGRLVLPNGMNYRLLVLPPEERMTVALARKVRELAEAGALVVGPRPEGSPSLAEYPKGDAEVQAIGRQVWGQSDGQKVFSNDFGKGRVVWGEPMDALLRDLKLSPDFAYKADGQAQLQFIHRRVGDTELYFISSQEQRPVNAVCTFRVNGKAPELWYPDSGRIVKTAIYGPTPDGTAVPLRLDAAGSVFVVFREPAARAPVVSIEKDGQTLVSAAVKSPQSETETADPQAGLDLEFQDKHIEATAWENGHYTLQRTQGKPVKINVDQVPAPLGLNGPWDLRFPSGWGAPQEVTLEFLISWSQHSDPGVKYFSGTATYHKEFEIPAERMGANREIALDLGQVKDFAEVWVNGKECGLLWKPPFRLDISGAVQAGKNVLEVKVTNRWPNRLIGDSSLPEAQRLTKVNWNPYKPDSPLLDSGLLGPVNLLFPAKLVVKD